MPSPSKPFARLIVVSGLVAIAFSSAAPTAHAAGIIERVIRLGEDRWQVRGHVEGPECQGPGELAVDSSHPQAPTAPRELGRVQGSFTRDFTFVVPGGSDGVYVALRCNHFMTGPNSVVAVSHYVAQATPPAPSPSPSASSTSGPADARIDPAASRPPFVPAGAVAVALVAGAVGTQKMRRRSRKVRGGHSACATRHTAAGAAASAAAGLVRDNVRAEAGALEHAIADLEEALREARDVFSSLTPVPDDPTVVAERVIDALAEQITRTHA